MDTAIAAEIPFDSEALAERVVRQLKVATEDWFDQCRLLSEFEERYLMDDPLNEDALKKHSQALDGLELVGRLISHATEDTQFPDRHFASIVSAMIQDLKDRRAMWHKTLPPDQCARILREAFNEV